MSSLELITFIVLFAAIAFLSWRLDRLKRYITSVAAQSAFTIIVQDNITRKLVEKDICKETDIFQFGSPIIRVYDNSPGENTEIPEDNSK